MRRWGGEENEGGWGRRRGKGINAALPLYDVLQQTCWEKIYKNGKEMLGEREEKKG